jgi:hypothetical protein
MQRICFATILFYLFGRNFDGSKSLARLAAATVGLPSIIK